MTAEDGSAASGQQKQLPLVTVGLPTYNRANALSRAISSVLQQDYRNIELVISDNASTDETEELCRQLCERDSRVKYFRQERNIGPSLNFREVLTRASGEFFMWLADDDWLDHEYVGRCMEVLLNHADHALVCGTAKYFRDGQLEFTGEPIDLPEETGAERMRSYYRQIVHNGTFYGVIRRRFLNFSLPLNTLGGDWLLIATVAYQGKIATVPDVAVYRNCGGLSRSLEAITTGLGISRMHARVPHASIAYAAWKDVAWRSDAYDQLSKSARLSLANKVFSVFSERWFRPYWYGVFYPYWSRPIFFAMAVRDKIKGKHPS